jgi:hypothetical protein
MRERMASTSLRKTRSKRSKKLMIRMSNSKIEIYFKYERVKSKLGTRGPAKLILISPIVSTSKKPLVDLECICLSILDLIPTYSF